MTAVTIRVSRFDPASGEPARLVPYMVELHEGARVLHALHAAHDLDPTLAYRYCCGSGQCGSCAVKVNGKPVLACMTPVAEGDVVEPLDLPVVRDLVVDLVPRLERVAALLPGGEGTLPDAATVDRLKELCHCIECGSCISVCPAVAVTDFAGPTAMRQLERLGLDPRDAADRIAQADADGLFACTSCQACAEVCPKEIRIPGKAIERLRAEAHRRGMTLPRHAEVAEPRPRDGPVGGPDGRAALRAGRDRARALRPGPRRGRLLRRVHVRDAPARDRARRDRGAPPERHPGRRPAGAGLLRLAPDPDGPARRPCPAPGDEPRGLRRVPGRDDHVRRLRRDPEERLRRPAVPGDGLQRGARPSSGSSPRPACP